MKTITESLEFLDKMNPNMINNTGKWTVEQMMYDDCKMHSYLNIEDYESILKELLKDKPKRIFDIGCNMNQYGFLFANEGIEYYGIDILQNYNPIRTDMIHFIHADFNKIKDIVKNEVVISCLCVGYLVNNNFTCKKLITNKNIRS